MFRFVERYKTPIAVLLAVLGPLAFYRANAVDPAEANFFDRLILIPSGPVRHLMVAATGWISDSWYGFADLSHAREQNAELSRRVLQLEREREALDVVAEDNRRLTGLLGLKALNPEVETLAATVIGAGSSPFARTIDVDLGALDGVRRGAPVVAEQGLVGIVQRVGWTTSEIALVADERVTVMVEVVRSRARGRLRGRGLAPGFKLQLGDVLRVDDVQMGDRVITSGLGGVFPKGVPVGIVTAVRVEEGIQHRVADVEPYVDFARLEHLLIIGLAPPEQPLATPEPMLPATLRTAPQPDAAVDAAVEAELDAGPPDAEAPDGGAP